LGWARSRQYTDAAINDFAQVADSYLVATAAVKGMTVVTYEKPQPNAKKRVLIPDVCNAFGVPYCDLNDMLRGMGEKI
jgi:3-polyprenyl-4-hydroxybenzoate decarboxylase